MKIDFHGRYKDISRYLTTNASARSTKDLQADFKNFLGQEKLKATQPAETTKKNPVFVEKTPSDIILEKGPMASVHVPEPKLAQAPLSRQDLPLEEDSDLNIKSSGVKTPTILKANRVSSSEASKTVKSIMIPLEDNIVKKDIRAQLTPAQNDLSALAPTDRKVAVQDMLKGIASEQGVDPNLSLAVAYAESSFDPKAVSTDGHESKGLFQLLDRTAKDVIDRDKLSYDYQPFEPGQNAELGVRYLRRLHDLFSSENNITNKLSTHAAENSSALEKFAVAAYNAGEGRVASAQDRAIRAGFDPKEFESVAPYLPESTQDYVGKVLSYKDSLERDS